MVDTAKHVALLAPVPEEHLADGVAVVNSETKVAFGSRAWEVFRQLDELREGMAVDVYIYASHAANPGKLEVTWHGRYIGQVESIVGAHPEGMRYRPPSTAKYPSDNSGYWAIFWELNSLKELPAAQRIGIGDLTGYGKKKRYGQPFVPEGPLLIEHP